MTEATKPEATPQPTAAPVADKAKAKAKAPAFKRYVSTSKQAIPFDIQVKGVVIQGGFTRDTGIVVFDVPEELVEGFEMHHHFQVGNVKAEEPKKDEKKAA